MISLCNETRWCKLLTLFYICATSLHNKLLDSIAHMCCVLIWCKILNLMKIPLPPSLKYLNPHTHSVPGLHLIVQAGILQCSHSNLNFQRTTGSGFPNISESESSWLFQN